VADRAVAVGEGLRFRRELGLPVTALAMLDTLRGDVLHAEHLVQRALTIDRVTSYSWASVFARPLLAVICDLHGRTDDANDALVELESMMGSASNWTRAARLLHLASWARRGEHIDLGDAPVGVDATAQASIGVAGLAAAHVALADATGEPGVADGAVALLEEARQRGLVYVASLGVLVDRSLGRALALSGRHDEAIEMLQHALERARADGAAIEVARSSRDLANTLRDRMAAGDDARAAGLHDDHVRICQALGLDGLLALAPTPLAPAPGSSADLHAAVVMIVDICDSTVLAGRLGDVAYAEEVRSVLDRVYARVTEHGGRVINHTGDGALVSFDDAGAAIDCALACHDSVRSDQAALHLGVHAGDVVELDGNLFGVAVNTAARLCDQARSGETVISHAVRELVGAGAHRYEDRGVPTLKGVADELQLFAVAPY